MLTPPSARQVVAERPAASHPLGAAVAQVLDTYVIAVAADGGLVLVDQHAAHERLTHEAIRDQMFAGGVASQRCCCRQWSSCRPATPRDWWHGLANSPGLVC